MDNLEHFFRKKSHNKSKLVCCLLWKKKVLFYIFGTLLNKGSKTHSMNVFEHLTREAYWVVSHKHIRIWSELSPVVVHRPSRQQILCEMSSSNWKYTACFVRGTHRRHYKEKKNCPHCLKVYSFLWGEVNLVPLKHFYGHITQKMVTEDTSNYSASQYTPRFLTVLLIL